MQALVAAGALSEKDAGPLLTKLENAFAPDPDRLTPEEGQALIDAAQSIIDQLEA